MADLWLGSSKSIAQYVFVLPNKPLLPSGYPTSINALNDVAKMIELNGNHWRKIFTIMSKLVVPTYSNWRDFRDTTLLNEVGVAFSIDQIEDFKGIVFIVGNTFRDSFPVSSSAQVLGDRHIAHVALPYIWTPYLDYRQFPNILIESLREYTLEK